LIPLKRKSQDESIEDQPIKALKDNENDESNLPMSDNQEMEEVK
jgi:hypothetical protein